MKKLVFILCCVFSFSASAISYDIGVISEIYSDNEGHVGIKISSGFTNAESNGECPAYNGWVGLYEPHPNLVKAIYKAFDNKVAVNVVTNGCEGPTWIKLLSIYQTAPN